MSDYTQRPSLVAHRGEASLFPENSLAGIEAALEVGAPYVEIDVQMSQDGVIVLCHDDPLQRICGRTGHLTKLPWSTLKSLSAGEPERFGKRFEQTRLTRLDALNPLFLKWSEAGLMVEVKAESIACFGIAAFIDQVLKAIEPIQKQAIIISYDAKAITYARQQSRCPIGWILHRFDQDHLKTAQELQPDFLIGNVNKVSADGLWPGHWQWMLYEFTDPDQAIAWHRQGADLIETMTLSTLLQSRQWQSVP